MSTQVTTAVNSPLTHKESDTQVTDAVNSTLANKETAQQITDAISKMRLQVEGTDVRPTTTLLRAIVDDVRACVPLDDTAEALGLDRMEVLNTAAKLGIWISHVHGGANVTTVTAASLKKPLSATQRKNTVVVPLGYQRGAEHRREVSKALAAIVVFNPDDDELARFVTRQYKPRTTEVDYHIVTSIWYAATQGRLHDVIDVNPGSTRFVQSALTAYDILSLAVQRAQEGVRTIMEATVADLDDIEVACTKSEWVAQREFSKIRETVAAVRESPSSDRILERELGFLRTRINANPQDYFPRRIADLSKAHVRKIALAAGVTVEPQVGLKKAAIRSRLRDMGFGSDVDMLIHQAAAADRAGAMPAFWEAMEARANGEIDWDIELAARLDSANAEARLTTV
jgi:hypothetical protein